MYMLAVPTRACRQLHEVYSYLSRIDNPLLHYKPSDVDKRARQFARGHGLGHLEQIFVKVFPTFQILGNMINLTQNDRAAE